MKFRTQSFLIAAAALLFACGGGKPASSPSTTSPDATSLVGAWLPAGHGELTESITLAADGNSYTSKLHYASFDKDGKPQAGGGEATGAGTRIVFSRVVTRSAAKGAPGRGYPDLAAGSTTTSSC